MDYDTKNIFTYHAPKENQQEKYKLIRQNAQGMAMYILNTCPDTRERSLALTKLEECVMWANASIARD